MNHSDKMDSLTSTNQKYVDLYAEGHIENKMKHRQILK